MFIFIYQEQRWMIMLRHGKTLLIVLTCTFLFCTGPATAAINTIQQGNVVFIGEQGLDVSAAMGPDTKIGWWASAADIATTSPTQSVDMAGRITDFIVNPSEFEGYTGNWYRLNSAGRADGVAFLVADPQLTVTYDDTTVDVNPALHWVPSGDDIRFKLIQTWLDSVTTFHARSHYHKSAVPGWSDLLVVTQWRRSPDINCESPGYDCPILYGFYLEYG
jgi:hypothetical protein